MSLATWKAEYYPVEASSVTTDAEALAHSLRKWEGLRAENLARHGVRAIEGNLRDDGDFFEVDGYSCALCEIYLNSHGECDDCPLFESRNERSCCDRNRDTEVCSPYDFWCNEHNPLPMLEALAKAQRWYEERAGSVAENKFSAAIDTAPLT